MLPNDGQDHGSFGNKDLLTERNVMSARVRLLGGEAAVLAQAGRVAVRF